MICAICGKVREGLHRSHEFIVAVRRPLDRFTVGIHNRDYGVVDRVIPRFAAWGTSVRDESDAHNWARILNEDAQLVSDLSWGRVIE